MFSKDKLLDTFIIFLAFTPHTLLLASVFGGKGIGLGIDTFKDLLETIQFTAVIAASIYALKAYNVWKNPLKHNTMKELYVILDSLIIVQEKINDSIEKTEQALTKIDKQNNPAIVSMSFISLEVLHSGDDLIKTQELKKTFRGIEFEVKRFGFNEKLTNKIETLITNIESSLVDIRHISNYSSKVHKNLLELNFEKDKTNLNDFLSHIGRTAREIKKTTLDQIEDLKRECINHKN